MEEKWNRVYPTPKNIKISFRDEGSQTTSKDLMEILQNGDFLNYDEKDTASYDKQGIIHGGEKETYLISSLSSSNKYSMRFVNCLGIVASGKSSAGEPLSFLTHQDTPQLYHNKKMAERFYRDLYNQLMLLKRKAEYETLDAVIFGGNGYLDWTSSKMLDKYYDNGIQIVAKVIQDVLGFDAYIAHGPKQQGGHNDVFFDTEKNLLYIVGKLGLSSSYRPFLFSQLSEAKKVRKQFSYKN